jgi:ribosomal protein L40E
MLVCPQCGFENPSDREFCTNCAAELKAPAPPKISTEVCPQCGSQLSPEAEFCSQCGVKLINTCPQCGSQLSPEAEFCSQCGAKLINVCPKCDAQLSLEAQFCNQCGAKLINVCPKCGSEVTAGILYCIQCGQDLTREIPRPVIGIAPEVKQKQAFPLSNAIAAGVGAIMMLVSLAVPWYAIRAADNSVDISANDLLIRGTDIFLPFVTSQSWTEWVGFALPLILMTLFASLVLFSVFSSLFKRSATRGLWVLLGSLSALCVIASAVYFLWWIRDNPPFNEWVNIVHAGSALAFIGALVVIFSALGRRTD